MRQLVFQVTVGEAQDSPLYKICTQTVESYAKIIGADYFRLKEPRLRITPDQRVTNRSIESFKKHGGYLPIFEKMVALELLSNYDQIAIIDADVEVADFSRSIFDDVPPTCELAAVVERNMPVVRSYRKKLAAYSENQFGPLPGIDWRWNSSGAHFYNMGVLVINRSLLARLSGMSAHSFITQPKFKDFVDGIGNWKWSTDQTLLNYWIKSERLDVLELEWKWNSLFGAIPPRKIRKARFVHYFLGDHIPRLKNGRPDPQYRRRKW